MASKAAELKLRKDIQAIERKLGGLNQDLKAKKTTKQQKVALEAERIQTLKDLNKKKQQLQSLKARLKTQSDTNNRPRKKPKLMRSSTVIPSPNKPKNINIKTKKNIKTKGKSKDDSSTSDTLAKFQAQMEEMKKNHAAQLKAQKDKYQREQTRLKSQLKEFKGFSKTEAEFMEHTQSGDENQLPTPVFTPQNTPNPLDIPSSVNIPESFQQKALEKLYSSVLSQKLINSLDWSTKFSGDGMTAEDTLNFRRKYKIGLKKEKRPWVGK